MSNLNGGAEAIKGFNYQKAIACLICVLHHDKDDFIIYVENNDDIEVFLNDTQTFIQAKGMPLSINKLTSLGTDNKSILGKNLINNGKNHRFKVVTYDSFAKKDKENLIESDDAMIFSGSFEFSDSQKEIIIEKLKKEGFEEEDLKNKINNCYIYITPFKKKYKEEAIPHILGKMVEKGIFVDNGKGNICLNELCNVIDFKSEINRKKEQELNPDKSISSDYLKSIFTTNNKFELQEKILKNLENIIGDIQVEGVKKELDSISVMHRSLKHDIKEIIESVDIDSYRDYQSLINDLFPKVKELSDNDNAIYAVIVDLVTEKRIKG